MQFPFLGFMFPWDRRLYFSNTILKMLCVTYRLTSIIIAAVLLYCSCLFVYRKSSIKPLRGSLKISNTFEGGRGLNRDGVLIWEEGLFNSAKTMVKELEYKVEKLKYNG